jgi:CubicO group peptidase (beta-lactamase class C family)
LTPASSGGTLKASSSTGTWRNRARSKEGIDMKIGRTVCLAALTVCFAVAALAQSLPKAGQPEDVGFSTERLKRLGTVIQSDVDKGAIPGAVVLLARKGKVAYLEAFGFRDREKQVPMKTDAVFRIASMTKPFTSVAIMMLVEEGRIQISDPISTYLPELKGLEVGIEKLNEGTGKPELSFEAARREITIQDLLRHTSGFTYGIFGKSLVKQTYLDAKLGDPSATLAEFVAKLSKLPLAYQPGTTWDYGVSTDVLGRIVEVVSGVGLDEFIAERIAKPFGLADTGFFVGDEKAGRVAEPQVDDATGKRPPMRDATKRPNFLSGGGGMVSTASDYARFAQALLNGGELDGVRILSPRTVAYMTSDHLPPGIAFSPVALQLFGSLAPTPEQGQGFGLGFAVRQVAGRNSLVGSAGEFYWVGAYGTAFWVDPQEKLVAVWMVQLPLTKGGHYRSLIRNLVYQALID